MGGAENRATVGSRTELVFYKDEELDAYEMGYKGLLFDETLQMTASLYYYDYRNYQDHVSRWETTQSNIRLPAGVSPIPGRGPVEQTVNIPKAFNYGFEADATWLATEAFTLGGNFSYTISEYDTPFYIFNQNIFFNYLSYFCFKKFISISLIIILFGSKKSLIFNK